jgi:hypothetical protein
MIFNQLLFLDVQNLQAWLETCLNLNKMKFLKNVGIIICRMFIRMLNETQIFFKKLKKKKNLRFLC